MIAMTASTHFRTTLGRRQGFTLVELLVAMALIIFIMVILTEAFAAGTGAFRALKSAGDMQERLRAAESLIRQDLVHSHFSLVSQTLSSQASQPPTPAPTQGYFFIQQSGSYPPAPNPWVDSYGNPAYFMWPTAGAQPFLCFTVNLGQPPGIPPTVLTDKGYSPADFFVARIPDQTGNPGPLPALGTNEQVLFACGPLDYLPSPSSGRWTNTNHNSNNVVLSQWAEVAYFLVPTGRTAGTNSAPWNIAPPSPPSLFSLRRRVRVVLNTGMRQGQPQPGSPTSDDTAYNTLNNTGPRILNATVPSTPATDIYKARFAEMSCLPDKTNNLWFNSPGDLCYTQANRMYNLPTFGTPIGIPPAGPSSAGQFDWYGDDLVVTDLVSFNVRVLKTGGSDFTDLGLNGTAGNYTADNANWSATNAVTALEITLRIWDPKTSLARQVTIIQDM
jgi:prepilin-type N-terminal cleavage/methylation domain-containing protein